MRLLLIVMCGLMLAACNMTGSQNLPTPDEENTIYVTATPQLPTPNAEGVIVITATPNEEIIAQLVNSPVAVQPSATPEIVVQNTQPQTSVDTQPVALDAPADQMMDQAAQYMQNGNYPEAVRAYDAIVQQGDSVAPDVRAEAAFRKGQAAVREGLFEEAVSALTILIDSFPDDERVPQAYFLRGDARLGLSQWQPAIADFQQFIELRPGLLDSYAYERIGDAQIALGQQDTALASYQQALNGNRPLVPELILRERVAQILIGIGDAAGAVAQYDAILSVAQNAPYRASIQLAAARALVNAGMMQDGLTRARDVFEQYTDSASAYPAMQLLLENGSSVDAYMRGVASYYYGDYQGAIEAFNEYSSNTLLEDIPARLYYLLGLSYREIGNPDAANIAFQTIIDQYPADPLFGDALLQQGRTRFLSGDIDGAIQTYSSIAERYSNLTEVAAEALWRVGYLHGTRDRPVESRETFVRLAQDFPNNSWASNGLLLAASAAVKAQEWQVAENLYSRIASIASGEDQAAAFYWVGRLAAQRGDTTAAQDAYNRAAQIAPDSYFGARARDIQRGLDAFEPPQTIQFNFDEAALQNEAENWLRTTFQLEAPGDLSTLNSTLANDPRLQRGTALWAVASYDEANDEFDALLDEARAARDALTAYQMAIYLRDMGAYYMSIVAAADVITAAEVSTLEAPRFIARLRYPAYYLDLIQQEAERYGFDPLLMLALIRQESLFDASAQSVASAVGLTQVIPATGEYIAQRLGFTDFQVSDLTRPYVSIPFGSYYLDEQLRLFDGNEAAALAAYNGGPGNALDWYALSGGEVDLLLTTITFDETRSYVQRIYSHYNLYRDLYGVN